MKKKLTNKLDKAWSLKIREYGMCEKCHKISPLNAHHFYSRRCRSVRWDTENGFCLCPGCHTFSSVFSAHLTAPEFDEWAVERRGQKWYDDLKVRKNTIMKYIDSDFDDLLEGIKGESNEK